MWKRRVSIPVPRACEARALPIELRSRGQSSESNNIYLVSPSHKKLLSVSRLVNQCFFTVLNGWRRSQPTIFHHFDSFKPLRRMLVSSLSTECRLRWRNKKYLSPASAGLFWFQIYMPTDMRLGCHIERWPIVSVVFQKHSSSLEAIKTITEMRTHNQRSQRWGLPINTCRREPISNPIRWR